MSQPARKLLAVSCALAVAAAGASAASAASSARVGSPSELAAGTLRNARTAVRIRVGYPALAATRRESSAARERRAGKLRLMVVATDAVGRATQLAANIRPRG